VEVRLLNEIENKFLTSKDKLNNKKLVMFIGDYSRTSQMKGTIPTPNIGLKKLLLTRFNVIEVNEYNTSKLYNKTLKEMKNVKIRRKKHVKYLHEILTPKEETEKCIYVNRDVNACKNIRLITQTYLIDQKRPIEFTRVIKPKEKLTKIKTIKKTKEIVV